MNVIDVFINSRNDIIMDRQNVLKRSSDREPSEGAKCQRVEGHASGSNRLERLKE